VSIPRLDITTPHDEPVILFRRAFQAPAVELYAAAGAERGLAECHERLDELLAALAPRSREGQRQCGS
jgi:hypothetical protein